MKFYKTKKWEELIKLLRLERVSDDGVLYCEHCGKPIIKSYDCIGHHKVELNASNVNNADISLNPDNIILVHHKCHNKIHKRFGTTKQKEVFLVYGPPCSGKSSWVKDNAGKNDLVLDVDNIWQMISVNERYEKPSCLKYNVFNVRDCILDMIAKRYGKWERAYIIGGYPLQSDRERLDNIINFKQMIFINNSKEICLQRAKDRAGWDKFINEWFEIYRPPNDQQSIF